MYREDDANGPTEQVAPMFNKFTPLPADSPLTTQLSALAKRVDFPLGKIWVCDSSKRSSHSNAFFYGVPFLTKHIVLFDTLIEKNSTEEVLAVLGHELGHFKKGHNISLLLSTDTYVLFLLVLFTTSVQSPAIFSSFGFPSPSATSPYPILLGFILAQDVFGPLDCLAQFVMHSLSRRFEYQADEFAKNLGYAEQLKRGLVRIGADNMGVTDCHKLWSAYHHSHPTLGERIERLDDSDDKKKE
ncbi:caax prenyl protease 1 [Atractiella rhizophila]|nr:caax prenyl protease 1 [Atractiella rhizophila]